MSQDQPTPEELTPPTSDRPRRRPRPSSVTQPQTAEQTSETEQTSEASPETAASRINRRRERLAANAEQPTSKKPPVTRQGAQEKPSAEEQGSQNKLSVESQAEISKPAASKSSSNKVLQTVTQVVQSVFNVLKKPIVGTKLYTNNKARLDAGWKQVQPLVKLLEILWSKILKPLWNKVIQPLWSKILGLLRPRLPQPLKTLSDQLLTAIVLGPVILLWWLISSVTSGSPVAQVPAAPPVVVSKPTVSAPVAPPMPTVEAPEIAATVLEPEPEEPQKEVLSVQRQVAEISDRNPDIIPSVQADFEANRLVVQVSDRWYDLSNAEQDDIGLDILKRSGDLEFEALELRDGQGLLVARDPVVGPNIIVLQRHHQA
ncbi:MAG: hypothetical protein ACFCU8_12230 [Thermosynechococcaceae cyanobacterium]